MLTHKSIMAAGKCPDCKGSGKYLPDLAIKASTETIKNRDCPTCKRTGNAKVVWTEPIENILDGYEFEDVDTFWTTFFKKGICEIPGTVNKPFWKVKTPYKTGQVITAICEKCKGSGWVWWDELDIDSQPEWQEVDDTRYTCDECKGKPELKVKVTAISVVNNEFRMEGDLL